MGTIRALVTFVLWTIGVAFVYADGMAFIAKDFEESKPSFPSQRAILKWQDGIETLIIESVLSGPNAEYGWIVPLPQKPSFVKAAHSEYLQSVFHTMRPPIRVHDKPLPAYVLVFSLFAAALWLTQGYRSRKSDLSIRIIEFFASTILLVFVFVVVSTIARGREMHLARSTPAASEGGLPTITDLGTIGSYQVKVISGKDGTNVVNWLRNSAFSVPPMAANAIAQYAKEGWVFLAAKIRKDRSEPWPLHPLKAVFPAEKPIYPMRLTAAYEIPMRLELTVIGPARAFCKELPSWSGSKKGIEFEAPLKNSIEGEVLREWDSSLYKVATKLDYCTYMRADLELSSVKHDFTFEWKDQQEFAIETWSVDAARNHTYGLIWPYAIGAIFLVGLLGTIFSNHWNTIVGAGTLSTLLMAAGIGWNTMRNCTIVPTDEIANTEKSGLDSKGLPRYRNGDPWRFQSTPKIQSPKTD